MSESNLNTGGHAATMEGSPYAIPSRKLTMWLFIISDAVTFGAILFAYGYLRTASTDWPDPFKFNPSIMNVMIMTFILITSSLTMLLGAIFAGLHIREWMGLIHEGVRMFQNPWGAPLFGATFFSITGLHLLHVISGIVALSVIARGFARGSLSAGHVESVGLYWHFVDVVWMFVVPLVYLVNIAR